MTSETHKYPALGKPEDIPQYFANAWNKKDANYLAAMFHEHAEFINVVGLWWHTRADIQKAHDYGFRVIFPDSHLTVTKVKVRNVTDSIAIVYAKMHLHGQSSHKGQKAGHRRNIFTFVVQKKEVGWICISTHNTDIAPGKETHITDGYSMTPIDYRD